MKKFPIYALIVLASFAIVALVHIIMCWFSGESFHFRPDFVTYGIASFFFAAVNCFNYYQWQERKNKRAKN